MKTFVELIRGVSLAFPLMLVCEDAQCLDSGSWQVMNRLASKPVQGSLFVTTIETTATDIEELKKKMPESLMLGAQTCQVVYIEPLPRPEIASLARIALRAKSLSTRLEILLMDKSGGNPYACLQTLAVLVEGRQVRVSTEHADLSRQVENVLLAISGSPRDLTLARLRSLPEEEEQIVQLASVIGFSFPLTVIQSIAFLHDCISPIQFHGILISIFKKGWLRQTDNDNFNVQISFLHSLTRSTIYESLRNDWCRLVPYLNVICRYETIFRDMERAL